jgi:hypothetical protein
MVNNVYPKYIDDIPIGDDRFVENAHTNIAKSILEHIRKGLTMHHLIGLEGCWGSGKSNVIEIMRKLIKEQDEQPNNIEKFVIYTYDAWGHQEDLQRRSFLEELTNILIKSEQIDENVPEKYLPQGKEKYTWVEKLEDLLAKKIHSEVKQAPKIGPGYILSMLGLILAPLFGAVASNVEKLWISIVVAVIPIFLVGIISIVLYSNYKKKYRKKSNTTAESNSQYLTYMQFLFALIDKDQIDKTTTETVSEREPSVRQFKEWMRSISDSLEDKSSLIIVFDNMDRLPKEKVKEIWSNIYTFFAGDLFDEVEKNKMNPIWVIVPYDKSHLHEVIFKDEKSDNLSRLFLNKTFSVTYRVSQPIMSEWRDYFDYLYHQAFGETQEDSFEDVRNIFEYEYDNITPREIITFINEIVSIIRSNPNKIKLKYIALFVRHKDTILKDPFKAIRTPDYFIKSKSIIDDDFELANTIAAIVYNIELTKAYEVVIRKDIERVLREKDIKTMIEYSRSSQLHHILNWINNITINKLDNAIETLYCIIEENIEITKDSTLVLSDLFSVLGKQLLKTTKDSIELTKSEKIIIEQTKPLLKERVVKWIIGEFYNVKEFKSIEFFKAISELKKIISDNKYSITLDDFLTEKQVKSDDFIQYLSLAKQDYKYYKILCDNAELNKYIIEMIPDKLKNANAIQYIVDDDKYNLKEIQTKCSETIQTPIITKNNFLEFINFYKLISIRFYLTLLSDAVLQDLLESSPIDSDMYYELVTMRIAKGNVAFSLPKASTIFNSADVKLVDAIAERINKYKSISQLLIILDGWPVLLLQQVCINMIVHKKGYTSNLRDVLMKYKSIIQRLNMQENPKEFIDNLERFKSFLSSGDYIIDESNISTVIVDVEFYEHAIAYPNKSTEYLVAKFLKYIHKKSKDEWNVLLRNPDSTDYKSYYTVLEAKINEKIPHALILAVTDLLKSFITDNDLSNSSELLELIVDRIPTDAKKPLFKTILDELLKIETTSELFEYFYENLLNHSDITSVSNSSDVVMKILTPLISTPSMTTIINVPEFIDIIKNAKEDSEIFKTAILEKYRTELDSGQYVEQLKSFAIAIGCQIDITQDN